VGEPYALTAEFYDLCHAATYTARARAALAPYAAAARRGIVDVGAGTGLVTAVLAEAATPGVPVWAVEPSAPMRAVLMAKLVASPAMRDRVTPIAAAMQDVDLDDCVDLAVCIDTVNGLDHACRAQVWHALARAVTAGGQLVVDVPGRVGAGWPTRRIGLARLGLDEVEVTSSAGRRPDGSAAWTFRYVVRRGGRVIRDESECFPAYDVTADELAEELACAGFELVQRCPSPGLHVLVARRRSH
jgi:SAM-dependent methyltransferase